MFPYIVADIGGTNARFALVTGKEGGQFVIEHVNILSGAEFATFELIMQAYLDSLEGIKPKAACVAIAGPIDGDTVKMTNLDWVFSKKSVKEQFGFTAFDAINDFAAVAIATSRLGSSDLLTVKQGNADEHANKAILGPGTGLGVAGLMYYKGQWVPVPSEGGHVNLAPATAFEADILKAGMARFAHVSAEVFISGPGLVNLYQCVADVHGISPKALEPKDITSAALDGSDKACLDTLNRFCSFLGAFTGNLVLTYGAKGGAYLAGGILPRFTDFLMTSEFSERFSDKGVMSHYVKDVPASLITYDQIAFLGAAAWLEQLGA
ncbi:MAG: glucokinase [Alteromonadaceae bacterium]|nr:MAG: glucokinase [Alteromonadaceae bacterium]